MTADDIIAANPEYGYQPHRIGGMDGLKGKHPETGAEWWCVFAGNSHVDAAGPWDRKQIQVAAQNLSAAVGRVDRRRMIPRPTRAALG